MRCGTSERPTSSSESFRWISYRRSTRRASQATGQSHRRAPKPPRSHQSVTPAARTVAAVESATHESRRQNESTGGRDERPPVAPRGSWRGAPCRPASCLRSARSGARRGRRTSSSSCSDRTAWTSSRTSAPSQIAPPPPLQSRSAAEGAAMATPTEQRRTVIALRSVEAAPPRSASSRRGVGALDDGERMHGPSSGVTRWRSSGASHATPPRVP